MHRLQSCCSDPGDDLMKEYTNININFGVGAIG